MERLQETAFGKLGSRFGPIKLIKYVGQGSVPFFLKSLDLKILTSLLRIISNNVN